MIYNYVQFVLEIRHKLQCYTKPSENTMEALEAQAQKIVNSIDIPQIYNQSKQKIDAIVTSQDYDNLLKIYNRKSLHLQISSILKLSSNEYPKLILRMMKTDKKERIIEALKKHMPILDEKAPSIEVI